MRKTDAIRQFPEEERPSSVPANLFDEVWSSYETCRYSLCSIVCCRIIPQKRMGSFAAAAFWPGSFGRLKADTQEATAQGGHAGKIDYSKVSTDNNKLYRDFWPIVKNLWYNLIGIKPILVDICDTDDIIYNSDHIIHKIKKVEGINTGFQSQIARMYITKFYPEKTCITSDIDMLPLSKKYFVSDIESYQDDKLIIFSSDAYQNINRYPICYNAGEGINI